MLDQGSMLSLVPSHTVYRDLLYLDLLRPDSVVEKDMQ